MKIIKLFHYSHLIYMMLLSHLQQERIYHDEILIAAGDNIRIMRELYMQILFNKYIQVTGGIYYIFSYNCNATTADIIISKYII